MGSFRTQSAVLDRLVFFIVAVAITAAGAVHGHESAPDPFGVAYLGEALFLFGLIAVIVALARLATLSPGFGRG